MWKAATASLMVLVLVRAPGLSIPRGASRSPSRVPLGEVVAEGHVFLNGVRVTSGSTLFSGAVLRTADGRALFRLRSGAGVIALLPQSEARMERTDDLWTIALHRGTLLVRARERTQVISRRVLIRSEGGLYQVAAREEGIRVDALRNALCVRIGAGAAGTPIEERRLTPGASIVWREESARVFEERPSSGLEGAPARDSVAAPSAPQSRDRRRLILPALVIGTVVVALALTVARGEKSKVVSPVAPQR